MNNSQEIAILIKQIVEHKPFSISKMLSDIGLGRNTMSHLDNGSMLKADSLAKIAEYLDVSTDYLLGRTDQPNGYNNNQIHNSDNVALGENAQVHINNTPAENNDEMTSELIKRFNNLSFDEKLEVFNYIKNFKE